MESFSTFKGMLIRSLFLLAFFAIILQACKKEEVDTIEPTISFTSPVANANHQFNDTILFSGKANDDQLVTTITTKIQTLDGKFLKQGPSFEVHRKEYEFEGAIILDDEKIAGGDYTIIAEASDGINRSRAYRAISISSAPLKLRQVLITTGSNSSTLHAINSISGTPYLRQTFASETIKLATESRKDLLFVLSESGGENVAVDLVNNVVVFNEPAQFDRLGSDVFAEPDRLTVAYREGEVRRYKGGSYSTFIYDLPPGTTPLEVASSAEYCVAGLQTSGSGSYSIAINHQLGTAINQLPLDFEPIEILQRNSEEFYVVGNSGGQAKIALLECGKENLRSLQSLPAGKVFSACSVDEDRILLALESGIYYYQLSNNSLIPFKGITPVSHIAYDAAGNHVFIASNTNLLIYHFPDGASLNMFSFAESITALSIWHNR